MTPKTHYSKCRVWISNEKTDLLWNENVTKDVAHLWCPVEHNKNGKNLKGFMVVLEKTLQSPWDCKEIQPVHSEGYQPWDFFGRNDAKAETPVLWPPHAKSWLIGKDSDAEGDWGQEEKDDQGWDGWVASLTRWMWVWVNSGRWWWTGRPDVLRFMGSQGVGHDWVTELNWTENLPYKWLMLL